MGLALLIIAALGFGLWIASAPLRLEWRRRKLRAQPLPTAWRHTLRQLPAYQRLPPDLQLQLKRHVQVFMAEKHFVACDGLELTEAMRVSIAALACLLILNRRSPDYYPRLSEILVYPGDFAVERERIDAIGLAHRERQVLAGESWSHGQVVLSWREVQRAIEAPEPGHNVVIHEFAHQLDQHHGGIANGAPAVGSRAAAARWQAVMQREYQAFCQRLNAGQPVLLNPYGSTNAAEFFAVASETFFDQPQAMASAHPTLFGELARFYRVNPLSW